mmetsp:Transcript_15687/g.31882  ORF Transcript_15687/g.31882 Transcript_15687/m.31882 type:complete len:263 (+) Transcript_15687:1025-1813(+)
MALEVRQVRQSRVRPVEQPELHVFVGGDVLDDECAGILPAWTSLGEFVLDDPLGVVLGTDWPCVVDGEIPLHESDVLRSRGRRDAVDHGIGERTVLINPLVEADITPNAISELEDDLLGQVSVERQVVAGQHSERFVPIGHSSSEALHNEADGSLGSVRRLEVVLDERVSVIQVAGSVVEHVCLLGHSEAGNAGLLVLETREDLFRVFALPRKDVVTDGPDDLHRCLLGLLRHQRVQVVLLGKGLLHLFVSACQSHPTDAPR